jgi:hypothetical protein
LPLSQPARWICCTHADFMNRTKFISSAKSLLILSSVTFYNMCDYLKSSCVSFGEQNLNDFFPPPEEEQIFYKSSPLYHLYPCGSWPPYILFAAKSIRFVKKGHSAHFSLRLLSVVLEVVSGKSNSIPSGTCNYGPKPSDLRYCVFHLPSQRASCGFLSSSQSVVNAKRNFESRWSFRFRLGLTMKSHVFSNFVIMPYL